MDPVVTVTGLDHLVLLVADPERSLDFYVGLLGLRGDRVDAWRAGEVPFPSVRIDSTTIIDLFGPDLTEADAATAITTITTGDDAQSMAGGLDHLCLVIEPTDLDALAASDRVAVVRGPLDGLYGAQGLARSLYIRDPDGVVVELRSYDR